MSARRLLNGLILFAASIGAAPATAQFPIPEFLENTPFDPKTHNPIEWIPRADPVGSEIAVLSPPFIDADGNIWSGSGSGGRPGSIVQGVRAELRHDAQGRAFWFADYANANGKAKSPVRAANYDRPVASAPNPVQSSAVPAGSAVGRTTFVAHTDATLGRTYVYTLTRDNRLAVTRDGTLLHEGTYVGDVQRGGERYLRYRFFRTSNTAPPWALLATAEQRYECWIPADEQGTIVYSADGGRTFVDESLVPPAGPCYPWR